MQEQDREPVVTICLLAAMADGGRSPEEQALFGSIAARLGEPTMERLLSAAEHDGGALARAAERLSSPGSRRFAYEMAVSVVFADGEANDQELRFLRDLRAALAQGGEDLGAVEKEAAGLAVAPLNGLPPGPSADIGAARSVFVSQGIPTTSPEVALDNLIRKQALLTGALELLPQNIASLAIIPLQMRLVYRIGADYGHRLEGEQIRDLLGAMGIGAAAQVVEGMARRIVGGLGRGLLGSVLGGIVGGTAGAAAGAGLTFMTTYAMGHAAREYYAQGRQLSGEDLRALFARFRKEAEDLLPSVQEQIHQQSQHLDFGKLLASIRGVPQTG